MDDNAKQLKMTPSIKALLIMLRREELAAVKAGFVSTRTAGIIIGLARILEAQLELDSTEIPAEAYTRKPKQNSTPQT